MTICDLALFNIKQLQPYVPGKPIEELERELGISHIVKLASNENPLGPSEQVRASIIEVIDDIARYPDGNGFALKQALATKYGIAAEQLTLGNGSNDVLELIARVFLSATDEVIFSQYAFAIYAIVTQAVGAKGVAVPARDFGHDLDAMHQQISEQTKMIFIANPNNPTGTYIDNAELQDFLAAVPTNVIVVLDEAYVEYNSPTINSIDWLAQYPNLVITRTFSKAYGLAAVRIGYAMSSLDIADLMNRVRQPFNVNSIALAAAVTALEDQGYLEQSRTFNQTGVTQLTEAMQQMGLAVIPSSANFISVDVKRNGDKVFEDLLKQGVIVRSIANYGLTNFIRVSVGLADENQRFIEALGKML